MDLRFHNDSIFVVSGPTRSGKTEFVKKFIMFSNVILRHKINKIHWFHGIFKPDIPKVNFHKGLEKNWSNNWCVI